MYNEVLTINEYMNQGFNKEEAILVKEHDELFNKYIDGEATEKELERISEIAKIVGL